MTLVHGTVLTSTSNALFSTNYYTLLPLTPVIKPFQCSSMTYERRSYAETGQQRYNRQLGVDAIFRMLQKIGYSPAQD